MYAKLENGYLRSAPRVISWKGLKVNNPTAEKLEELGYKEVEYATMPADAPDGKYYVSEWSETESKIVQTWALVDIPSVEDTQPNAEEILDIIMGVTE